MDFILRPAELTDLDSIMTVEENGFIPQIQESRDIFEQRIKLCPETFLVFETDGSVMGYICGEYLKKVPHSAKELKLGHSPQVQNPDFEYFYISSFSILPSYRGNGNGKKLWNKSLTYFEYHFNSPKRFLLLVNQEWQGARHIYESSGFNKIRRFRNFFSCQDGISRSDGILMERQISAKHINPYHKEFGLISNVKYIISAMSRYSKLLLWLLPVGLVTYTVQRYLWTFITKFVIDIISRQGSIKELTVLIAVFSVLMLLLFLSQTFYQNKQKVQCIVVRMKLVMEKNMMMMTMPFELTEDPEILDCSQKAENASNGNDTGVEGMEHQIIQFVEQLGVVIFGLVILGTMNGWIILGMTALAGINFFISNKTSRYTKAYIWDPLALWWRKRWYMNVALADFSFAKDIRMYGLRKWLTDKFTDLNKERYRAQQKNNKIWFWRGVLNHILWVISQGIIYAYLIYRVYTHSLTIGNFTLYLTSSTTFFECISTLLSTLNNMLQKSREVDDFRSFLLAATTASEQGIIKNLGDVMQENGDKSDRNNQTPQNKLKVPDFDHYEFTFQNVSFKYPRSERYALKNLNLTVKAGERLAVVGLNGAGKSTFIKLLLRLYEPTEGRILLNGNDISLYDKDSYYRIFAPVFQEVNLFAFSLAENISMREPEITNKAEVQKCVEASGLDEKTRRLEKGLDTQLLKVIYDDGIDLSGGERQKLALSRALYKNSPVVVLDEPTAALDALAESRLYADFDRLIGGKTSIYISHRLSSTQFCNNVAMFKDGRMIEYGTHQSLMEKGGEYAKMFHIQAQYYIEDEMNNALGGGSYEN